MKTQRVLAILAFFTVAWLAGEGRASANHAGAIHLSEHTYPVFLYVFVALAAMLCAVLLVVWRMQRKLNKVDRTSEEGEALLYRRKFMLLAALMLVIGLFSVGMIYVFLDYDITHAIYAK